MSRTLDAVRTGIARAVRRGLDRAAEATQGVARLPRRLLHR